MILPAVASADDSDLRAGEKRARDFEFEGLVLDMSLESFRAKYPKAYFLAAESNKKLGLKCYSVAVPRTQGVYVFFLDDKLMEIRIVAGPEVSTKFGEREYTITSSKMEYVLGPAHDAKVDDRELIMKWDFAKVNRRYYYCAVKGKETRLYVTQSETADELQKRRKTKHK
jgi:hypothetical protein